MIYNFSYSKEKDLILKEARGIGFQNIIDAIKKGGVLDNIDHFNKKKYPGQKIFIIRVNEKVYAVPYVIDRVKKIKFLKTIYPSRKLRKIYDKKDKKYV